MRKVFLSIVLLACLAPSGTVRACDPDEDCVRCQITNPFNGGCTLAAEATDCIVRREACNGCLSAHALAAGATVECVVCVGGALASGGGVAPLCAAVCGSAAVAEQAAQEGGC